MTSSTPFSYASFTDQSLLPGNPEDHTDALAEFKFVVAEHVSDLQMAIGVFMDERKHLSGRPVVLIQHRRNVYEQDTVSVNEHGVEEGYFVARRPRLVAQANLGDFAEFYRWHRPDGLTRASEIADGYVDLFCTACYRTSRFVRQTHHRRSQSANLFGVITQGINEGKIRNLNAGFLTRTLVGIFNSTARLYSAKGALKPDDLSKIYMKLLMYGLSTDPS